MFVMVADTVKMYLVVLATWTLSEISEKYKAFYIFKSFILTKVKVNVNIMLLHMNLNGNMSYFEK